jgi:membrane associated rhomboid family serine protease
MIPLRDVIPSRSTPVVTLALIVVLLSVWLTEVLSPFEALSVRLRGGGPGPAEAGAMAVAASMFLHASWPHLVGNAWCLWIFGESVEDRLGHAAFAALYVACGVGGALAVVAFSQAPRLTALGASAAVAGVMGGYFALYPRSRVLAWVPLDIVEIPAVWLLVVWTALQLLDASPMFGAGGFALAGHLAGFALGVMLTARWRVANQPWE